MTYTAPTLKQKTQSNNFSGLVTDGNRVAMTGALGNFIQTIDATGTPVASPVTVNTTTTLTVPQGAVEITIMSVTNAVQVSEDSTQSAYFTLPAATVMTFDVARQQYVYLKTSSSTVVSFYFKVV
jgi:hypothetical protein